MFNRTAIRSFFAKSIGPGTLVNDFLRFAMMTAACVTLSSVAVVSATFTVIPIGL